MRVSLQNKKDENMKGIDWSLKERVFFWPEALSSVNHQCYDEQINKKSVLFLKLMSYIYKTYFKYSKTVIGRQN